MSAADIDDEAVTRERLDESEGLYVGWEELRRRVAPRVGKVRFKTLIQRRMKEEGFPPFREEWGGWYFPSVRKWLDSDNEVKAHGIVPEQDVEDGPENFDAETQQRARPQARPAPITVLDRQAGRGRPDGVPRHVHRAGSHSR